jgi:hypothetical protein
MAKVPVGSTQGEKTMADIIRQIVERFDEETEFGLAESILLSATNFSVRAVRRWLEDAYPGEKIPHATIEIQGGVAHWWILDGRSTTIKEIIEALGRRGVIAQDRSENFPGGCVYVPIPAVARQRAGRWN